MSAGNMDFKGMIWWWNPEMMSCLCSRALSENMEVDYCRKLIRVWNLKPVSPSCVPGNWPWPLKIHTFDHLVNPDQRRIHPFIPQGADQAS